MLKKFASIATMLAIVSVFAFAGCKQGPKQGGQAPEKTAPTTSPAAAPSGGGK